MAIALRTVITVDSEFAGGIKSCLAGREACIRSYILQVEVS
jgi:hypothetical protein